nr:putative ribonuclease H-like domain-containing protein [Tanacetum cinerariifolium]
FKLQQVWTLVDLPYSKRAIGTKWIYKNKKDERESWLETKQEEPRVNQEKDANVNSTNNINTVSATANAASIKDNNVDDNIVYGCTDDLNMHNLEEIVYSDEDEDVGAEANMTNLDTHIPISPILTTRINKDHTVKQIIRDIHSVPQTRRMTKNAAYASFKDFVAYQMDVKSAFLYCKVKEEGYVCQPPGFEDPEFPDRVYKDSSFELESYTDSDYAGASLDRKPTTGGCQFIWGRLISSQCKEQTVVANTTTKAEYVAASNCCG